MSGSPSSHYIEIRVFPYTDMALFYLTGWDEGVKLNRIQPLGEPPASAVLKMNADKNFPHGDWVTPVLRTRSGFVVSPAVKALLASLGATDVEYLPVRVHDKTGNALETHFVVHPLVEVDCIDRDQSVVTWNMSNDDIIDDVSKLVIREDALPTNLVFFRIKHLYGRLFAHRRVLEVLETLRAQPFQWQALGTLNDEAEWMVTEFEPPVRAAKKRSKKAATTVPALPPTWPLGVVAWKSPDGPRPAFLFHWKKVPRAVQLLLQEQLGPAAHVEVQPERDSIDAAI